MRGWQIRNAYQSQQHVSLTIVILFLVSYRYLLMATDAHTNQLVLLLEYISKCPKPLAFNSLENI